MADYNDHLYFRQKQQQSIASIIDANDAATETLRAEKVAAEKQAILAEAYRQMPADMRQRADEWGVRALMELVWLNGWDSDNRQSMRDSAALVSTEAKP